MYNGIVLYAKTCKRREKQSILDQIKLASSQIKKKSFKGTRLHLSGSLWRPSEQRRGILLQNLLTVIDHELHQFTDLQLTKGREKKTGCSNRT